MTNTTIDLDQFWAAIEDSVGETVARWAHDMNENDIAGCKRIRTADDEDAIVVADLDAAAKSVQAAYDEWLEAESDLTAR